MEGTYRFAGLGVRIKFSHELLKERCKDYKTECEPDIELTITQEDIEFERVAFKGKLRGNDGEFEFLALHRALSTAAAKYGVLLMHGSAVAVDGNGYIFTAPSGTGKSTHTALYMKLFGERAVMINDDKPFLRKIDGMWRVYGSPWNGKHRRGSNVSVPLAGICVLTRGEKNEIRRITVDDALVQLYKQFYRTEDSETLTSILALMNSLLGETSLYMMKCNMEDEAAEMSLAAMKG